MTLGLGPADALFICVRFFGLFICWNDHIVSLTDEDPELKDFGAEAFGGADESEGSEDDGYVRGPDKG